MSEPTRSPSFLTRRDVVKGAIALATLGVGSVLAGRDATAAAASPASRIGKGGPKSDRHRVAIVGHGVGEVNDQTALQRRGSQPPSRVRFWRAAADR